MTVALAASIPVVIAVITVTTLTIIGVLVYKRSKQSSDSKGDVLFSDVKTE